MLIQFILTLVSCNINERLSHLTEEHPAHISFSQSEALEHVALNENLGILGRDAICICILFGIILAFLLYFLLFKTNIIRKCLKLLFVIAWCFAFVVYDVGMYTGHPISLLANAPMAILHAFETFLLGSDVSAIHEQFHNNWIFMGCFSLSHAFSAFVSTTFIIKTFGFNIVQKLKLQIASIFGKKRAETYILWGVNDFTYHMVDSIKKHYGKDKAYRTIIVNIPNESENTSENPTGINKIFEFLSLNDSELQKLQEAGCLITNSNNVNDNSIQGIGSGQTDIISKCYRLKSLARIISRKTSEKIHVLLLSDDEKSNLHYASILLQDSTLRDFLNNPFDNSSERKVTFYCHARYNGVHRVIEDQNLTKNFEIRMIDSSHISVELLKKNINVLPVKFVDVEPDASVSSAFNSMVIGFSEVGQDMVRFLYEFGAFVKSGSNDSCVKRSDFHLDVVDNKMREKAGSFLANAPEIATSLSYIPELKDPDALIELHNEDCQSVEFYKMLHDKISTLNYIVIATENDELNMTMGVRILRAAIRYRSNLDKLCILIRIHNDEDGHFMNIAKYYNRLWAAQESVNNSAESLKDILAGKIRNKEIKEDDERCILPLYIFGQDKMVYTYQNIVDNTILREAIDFKQAYADATADNKDKSHSDSNVKEKAWYEDIRNRMQTDDEYHPTYSGVMNLRRTQRQDLANSLHKLTKRILRDRALALCGIENVDWASIKRYDIKTSYQIEAEEKDRIKKILRVLAQTEHLRWNASHEILGYVYDSKVKDEMRLKHDCLTEWEKLNEYTQSFDHNVVDLSFGIKIETLDKND